MKKYICLQVIWMCSILFASTKVHAYKYGLGSCLDQSLDQEIWPAIQEEKLETSEDSNDSVSELFLSCINSSNPIVIAEV